MKLEISLDEHLGPVHGALGSAHSRARMLKLNGWPKTGPDGLVQDQLQGVSVAFVGQVFQDGLVQGPLVEDMLLRHLGIGGGGVVTCRS